MRVLLLGSNGQLGRALRHALAPLGELHALGRAGADGLCGDLSDLAGITTTVRVLCPDVVVNAAARTDVDGAQSSPDAAWRVNAEAPAALAHAAADCGAWLVHYGSDYVFDGSGSTPWRESDVPAPLNAYGRGKLAGVHAIRQSGCRYLILRTSWLYSDQGRNFMRALLKRARTQAELTVVDDQWGAPTSARLVAQATTTALAQVLEAPEKGGLYHLCASGVTSRLGWAQAVFDAARAMQPERFTSGPRLRGVPTAAWPTPARRPLNSRLDTRRFTATFGMPLPPWQDEVAHVVAAMLEEGA